MPRSLVKRLANVKISQAIQAYGIRGITNVNVRSIAKWGKLV